jgi:hypothetical protein
MQPATSAPNDLTRATKLTPEVEKEIARQFTYQPWTHDQEKLGNAVRDALAKATGVIIANVPPGPDRTVALRKLREARMDCNSAISGI